MATVIRSKNLASLLAQEDLQVIFSRSADTAYFDSIKRTLVLPQWKTDNPHVIDALIIHEVGHALHSDDLMDRYESEDTVTKSYLNIMEDCRVDRLQRMMYPGTKKDYYEGYKSLMEMGIFEIDKNPVKDMILADRINMQSKIGQYIAVPFYNDEERELLKRAFSTETPEDVVEVALAVKAYDERVYGRGTNTNPGDFIDSSGASIEGSSTQFEVSDEGTEDANEKDVKSNGKGSDDKEKDVKSNGKGSDDKEETKQPSINPGGDEGVDIEGDSKTDKGSSEEGIEDSSEKGENDSSSGSSIGDDEEKTEGSPMGSQGQPSREYSNPPVPKTADSINRWEEENATKAPGSYWSPDLQKYLSIGALDPSTVLADGKEWRRLVTDSVKGNSSIDTSVKNLQKNEKKWSIAVAALQKEFSIWKQANTSSTVRFNRGSIDVNRLHLHKINDNIFAKNIVTTQRDQNHRIVFLLDISSSMFRVQSIGMVMDQLLIFRRFCLNEGIKFNVITFTSMLIDRKWREEDKDTLLGKYKARRGFPTSGAECEKYWTDRRKQDVEWSEASERAVCVEILNELDDDKWFACLYEFLTYVSFSVRDYNWFYPLMTPTNEAMNLVYCWMNGVRKTMRQDKLSLVVLTDGESTDVKGMNVVIKDVIGHTQMVKDDLIAPLLKGEDDSIANRLKYHTKFFVEFLILKAMKDNGIVDSIVWYNLCHQPYDATRCDLFQITAEKLMKELKIWDVDKIPSKKNKDFIGKLREGGLLSFDNPLPWIDKFFIYIPFDSFDYMVKTNNRITKADRIAAQTFQKDMRKKAIMKTLIASIAKCIA